jgi:phosphate transport system substrate-binding protein
MKYIISSILFVCTIIWAYGQETVFLDGSDMNVTASSVLSDYQDRYTASKLIDRTDYSWSEGAPGNGIGESFTITFRGKGRAAGFVLKNGYGQLDYYGKNNRVKSFKIVIDDNYSETIEIKDSTNFEQYLFKSPLSFSKMQFIITDVFPGTQYNDTCVAEIYLLSRPFKDEYELNHLSVYEEVLSGPPWVSLEDDIDLFDYFPFDTSQRDQKTKIALLDKESSLKFSDKLPRLDGATALYPLYSSFVHAVYPYIAEPDRFYEWSYFPYDFYPEFVYWHGDSPSIVQCTKTALAYQRLIDGKADIIFCYEPSRDQIQKAEEKGLRFNLTPIGKDAFIFFVNIKNTAHNLTQSQIRGIYSETIINWKNITGIDEPVIAYQRPENSGSQTILQSVMGDVKIMPSRRTLILPEMGRMINEVSSYRNYNGAIGYSFLYYTTIMRQSDNIKILSIDGIPPTKATILNNSYPFVKNVYAITVGNESENTKRFIDWILSEQGQQLVEKTGYVPIK